MAVAVALRPLTVARQLLAEVARPGLTPEQTAEMAPMPQTCTSAEGVVAVAGLQLQQR